MLLLYNIHAIFRFGSQSRRRRREPGADKLSKRSKVLLEAQKRGAGAGGASYAAACMDAF